MFLGQNLLLVAFCYNSKKLFISIIGIKIFFGENLLLRPLCYDIEKCIIRITGLEIFIEQNLFLFFFILVVGSVVSVS